MTEPSADSPPLPNERSASPAAAKAGCAVACGLALLLLLYVGSFAALVVYEQYDPPLQEALGDRTYEILTVFYWPLIWSVRTVLGTH